MQTYKLYNDKTRTLALVAVDYDQETVDAIRAIPGRKWHPGGRFWSVPVEHKDTLSRIVRAAKARRVSAQADAAERAIDDHSITRARYGSYVTEHNDEVLING